MGEPFPDVVQDLWQLSHLATGIIENNPIAIVVAALFLPFLSQVLAMSVGLRSKDPQLILQGARALLVSTGLGLAAGIVVASGNHVA